jgi:hypothetical protein
MVKDDLQPTSPTPPSRHGLAFQAAAIGLAMLSLSATGFLMFNLLPGPEPVPADKAVPLVAPPPPPPAPKAKSRLFQEWPMAKPDFVLLLSGEQHGYIQPCGCSRPQFGGLERRYNFLQSLKKDKGWDVVALDLGDVAQRTGPQTMLKYVTSMYALKEMGYAAVGVGPNEFSLPLLEAVAHYALNEKKPRVLAANLLERDKTFADSVHVYAVSDNKNGPKIGVIGTVGPSVAGGVRDPLVKFDQVNNVLPPALKQLAEFQPEVLVLLYSGNVDEAKACAGKYPQFHVILCRTREEEPPEKPVLVGNTLIVNIGHKGRYVGLVGGWKKHGGGFDLRYQLVPLGEEYETAPGKESDNPVLAQLEKYTRRVRDENFLAHYPKTKHPIQHVKEYEASVYVGSEKCKKCHPHAYEVWKNSPHAHAFHSLETATRPGLRQFDGECVVCHVVGFNYHSGYRNEKDTPLLKDVGCESCHGPGSLHLKNQYDKTLHVLMNPYRFNPKETAAERQKRMNLLDLSCQKCHDTDNDVHWKIEKWDKIVHRTPESEK